MIDPNLYYTLSIREATNADYFSLEKLHEILYKTKCTKGFYATKHYHYDLSLPAVISFVASTRNGEIIASAALIPLKLKQTQIFLGAQWADTMVHPSHQGRGLGLALCKACLDKAKRLGIDYVFCLPVEATFNLVTTKLDHQFVNTMLYYKINVRTLPLASITAKIGLAKSHASVVNNLFSKYKVDSNESFHSFSQNNLLVYRSIEYFEYKKSLGSFMVKIHETFIWLHYKNGSLLIGDIEFKTDDNLKKAISTLKNICTLSGIKSILFQTTKGSKTQSYFNTHFEENFSYKICIYSFNKNLNLQNLQLTYGDADNF